MRTKTLSEHAVVGIPTTKPLITFMDMFLLFIPPASMLLLSTLENMKKDNRRIWSYSVTLVIDVGEAKY